MSIRILRLGGGERFPMVAEHAGAPADPWITSYLLDRSRDAGDAFSTELNKAKALAAATRVCRHLGISSTATLGASYPPIEQLRALARGLADADGHVLTTTRPYFDEFVRYVTWVGDRMDPNGEDEARVGRLARFVKASRDARPPKRAEAALSRYGLTEEARDAFFAAITPAPDDERPMAFRNYVIGLLGFMLGLRSGEILGLKVAHVDTRKRRQQLRIVKVRDDPDDTRLRPAAQKTAGRNLPLSEELAAALDQLVSERRRSAVARKHPYLIVNQCGRPLSDRGFRDVYIDLRRRRPELSTLINHILRHDWNDRWNDMVSAKGLNRDEALRHRKYAMGWSEDSDMPLVYGRRSLEKEADERLLDMQRAALRLARR